MPNLLRNQSVIFFAIVYEISKSVIPLSNSVIMYLVIGFDFMSLVVNGIILGTTCNINIFKFCRNIQSEFWLIMAVQQAWSLAQVIKVILYSVSI